MKVAIVYDRVNKWGGAERVLLAIHEMFPKAPLYTSVYDRKKAPWAKAFPEVKTSFLQRLPFTKSNHEFLATLMPAAFEAFDFSGFDLVISVTSESAKGIKTKPGALHVCYCLTPTRYLWSHYNDYFKGLAFRGLTKPLIFVLRQWDKIMAKRPDLIIAISTEVAKRIKRYYSRNSEILFPPVNISMIRIIDKEKKYYLVVSRLDYGYKKIELAIEVFNKLGKPLIIIGTGRQEKKLKKMAKGNIKFVGKVSEQKLGDYYRGAKALIMPQEEDFGIVSLEAQSFGVPVIAFKKGGALDTVINGKTGIYFSKQNGGSLKRAILRFEKMKFKADNLHNNAKRFSKEKFKRNFAKIIEHATKKG